MSGNSLFLISSVAFLILVRWMISLHSYSGAGKPPMFGDFEAQRHWMEITYHLPYTEWYKNGSNNNLLYWGLDYPPLTAYHSWLCGFLTTRINASWVELINSHGLEDYNLKLFMRCSVLVSDVVIYMSSIFFFFMWYNQSKTNGTSSEKLYSAVLMLLYPGLLLIDHGHFQYNCMSLGLMIWAVNLASKDHLCCSSILFVLALNYKQMELYHSTAFFFYFLGKIFSSNLTLTWRLVKLSQVGVSVIAMFALCWLPFLSSLESFENVAGRLFPFNRGLFEDKVSNFWCSISLVIKLKRIFDVDNLLKLCLLSTLLSIVPSAFILFWRPSFKQFKYALVNMSLAFYLFSYQVHEKSILLPAVASILLYSEHRFAVMWFLVTSTFSMLPLFIKDGLIVPFISCCLMFCLFHSFKPSTTELKKEVGLLSCISVGISFLSFVVSSALILCVEPPKHLPDLFVVLISLVSCVHFILFFVFFNWNQINSFKEDQKLKHS